MKPETRKEEGEDRRPVAMVGANEFRCELCKKTFNQRNKIARHMKSKHSSRRPFDCEFCDKNFKYKCDLNLHLLSHKNAPYHTCTVCPYRTRIKNNLKTHYIRKHTTEYTFSCEHCGKMFKIEWDLKFHLATHGEAQIMCDVCGKFYASDHALYKHKKVAHLNVYEYSCYVCKKKLMTQQNLDAHLAQHSQVFDCKICGKVFAFKKYLKSHSAVHENKQFICEICNKCFRTNSVLRNHMSTHSTEKPFICDVCGRMFKRRKYLKEHRKKHPSQTISS